MVSPVKGLQGNSEGKSGRVNGAELPVRDPCTGSTIVFKIGQLNRTHGLREHVGHMFYNGKKPAHRPCLCRLYLEDRCKQGHRCKSIHADRSLVVEGRKEGAVPTPPPLFLREVPVVDVDGNCFAVRFAAVLKTVGAEEFKSRAAQHPEGGSAWNPVLLCPVSSCPSGQTCPAIHLRPEEHLPRSRRRTPCCGVHGDLEGATVPGVPGMHVARTKGFDMLCGASVRPSDVCLQHVNSRCKYGRTCYKVHVCRQWSGLASFLEGGEEDGEEEESLVLSSQSDRSEADAGEGDDVFPRDHLQLLLKRVTEVVLSGEIDE